jgi:GntR family transcriptional regulator
LDKKSITPLYSQIQQTLLSKIESGEWTPGTAIPAERELAEQFGVSRMTMRNALTALSRSGHLIREVGRGTFVANRRIMQTLNNLTSFSQEMKARGMKPGSELLRLWIEKAEPSIAEQLQISTDTPIFHLDRVRLADDQPLAIEKVSLQFRGCIRLLELDFVGSLYTLLSSKFGIVPHHARQQIQARICTVEESDLLKIPRKAPVLQLTRLTFTQDGTPFEYTESVYRSDKYIFDIQLVYSNP